MEIRAASPVHKIAVTDLFKVLIVEMASHNQPKEKPAISEMRCSRRVTTVFLLAIFVTKHAIPFRPLGPIVAMVFTKKLLKFATMVFGSLKTVPISLAQKQLAHYAIPFVNMSP